MVDCWAELGIEPTDHVRSVKRAYAKRLKSTRPDDDLAGFQRLREAYERALEEARYAAGSGGPEVFTDPFAPAASAAGGTPQRPVDFFGRRAAI